MGKQETQQKETEYIEFTFPIRRDFELAANGIAMDYFSDNFYGMPCHNRYEIRPNSRSISDPADIIVINPEENLLIVKVNKNLFKEKLERQLNQVHNQIYLFEGQIT